MAKIRKKDFEFACLKTWKKEKRGENLVVGGRGGGSIYFIPHYELSTST